MSHICKHGAINDELTICGYCYPQPGPEEFIKQLEASCAAMRDALTRANYFLADQYWEESSTVVRAVTVTDAIQHALSNDAGKALLERLQKAETSLETFKNALKKVESHGDPSLGLYCAECGETEYDDPRHKGLCVVELALASVGDRDGK